jgi:hypothetical protein
VMMIITGVPLSSGLLYVSAHASIFLAGSRVTLELMDIDCDHDML